jgi:serine/threonine protein kinase
MSLIRAGSIRDKSIAVEIVRQLLAGMADIHSKGIIHRDIKPQNVLVWLGDGVEVGIVDFGLALQLKEVTHIQQFKRCGTVGYIAPEVLEHEGEGKNKYGTVSDVFSCGIIAHMLLLGNNPLKGSTYEETAFRNRDCLFELV